MTSRLPTKTWPVRSSTPGPVLGCQPKWSPTALRSVRSKVAGLGANVMGYGLQFDESNASPWRERLALHTGTKAADWKVVLKKKSAPKWV